MFGIEFGNLAFNCEVSEQTLCIVVAGKNETSSIDEFIQKDNKGIICEIPDQEIEN